MVMILNIIVGQVGILALINVRKTARKNLDQGVQSDLLRLRAQNAPFTAQQDARAFLLQVGYRGKMGCCFLHILG